MKMTSNGEEEGGSDSKRNSAVAHLARRKHLLWQKPWRPISWQ